MEQFVYNICPMFQFHQIDRGMEQIVCKAPHVQSEVSAFGRELLDLMNLGLDITITDFQEISTKLEILLSFRTTMTCIELIQEGRWLNLE